MADPDHSTLDGPITDPAIAIPILPSLNVAESSAFYSEQLGFETAYHDPGSYLILIRDRMEIHMRQTDNEDLPKQSSCFIRGGQIVALYEEYANKGVPNLSDSEVRPWNMKEFVVQDPHGNTLRFAAAPQEIE